MIIIIAVSAAFSADVLGSLGFGLLKGEDLGHPEQLFANIESKRGLGQVALPAESLTINSLIHFRSAIVDLLPLINPVVFMQHSTESNRVVREFSYKLRINANLLNVTRVGGGTGMCCPQCGPTYDFVTIEIVFFQ